MPRNHGSVAGGGASRAYDESSWVPLYFCFLATAVGDLPHECACLECGNYFRRHLFLLIFPPRTCFSSHLQRQHPQGHTLISIVCEMDYFSN